MGDFLDKAGLKHVLQETTKLFEKASIDKRDPNFGLIWILYTNDLMRSFTSIESAAQEYAKYDAVVTHILNLNRLAPEIGTPYGYTANSKEIIKRAKELNPRLKRIEYLQAESERIDFTYNGENAYLNPDGSWEGSTAQLSGSTRIFTADQIRDWLKFFKSVGADGVFYDDWGYDWSINHICYQMGYDPSSFETFNEALNQKWIDLIKIAHEEGLCLVTNGGFPSSRGDWYTYLTEDDIICFESNILSSYDGYIENGQITLHNYWTNFYSKGLCKAKAWSMNYYPPDCNGEFREKVNTYVMNMALSAGAQYVSVGTGAYVTMPDYFQNLIYADEKTITQLTNYAYRILANGNTLETYKDSLISGTLTEVMIDKCYSVYNGHALRNAYLKAPYVDEALTSRVEAVEEEFANMTADTKKNAVSFWRMRIDDWPIQSLYAAYTNLIEPMDGPSGALFTITGDKSNFTATVDYAGWHGVRLFSINFSEENYAHLRGKTVEFGVMKLEINMTDGSPIPIKSLLVRTASAGEKMSQLPRTSSASVLLDNNEGYCYSMTIPEDCTFMQFCMWDPWFYTTGAGTIHWENAYFIDVNEHTEETTKTWYTNLINPNMNLQSAGVPRYVLTTYKDKRVYDVEVYATDPWGWSCHAFTSDEVIALRGKTIEFGCFECSVSDGVALGNTYSSDGKILRFGVGVSATSTSPEPSSYILKEKSVEYSEIWQEDDIHFVRFTVPTNAVGLTFGFRSYGVATNTVVTLKKLYMYDVNEEDLSIRGVDSAKSSLAICRIKEEMEEKDPSNVKNALYVTDKGRVWMVDAAGVKTNIADVRVSPTLTEGTLIGTININGEIHELYAPTGSGEASISRITEEEIDALFEEES